MRKSYNGKSLTSEDISLKLNTTLKSLLGSTKGYTYNYYDFLVDFHEYKVPIVVGRNAEFDNIIIDLDKCAHLAINGTISCEMQNNLIRVILMSIILKGDCDLYLSQIMTHDTSLYEMARNVKQVGTNQDEVLSMLVSLTEIARERAKYVQSAIREFQETDDSDVTRSIEFYNDCKPIILYIDDLNSIVENKCIMNKVNYLLAVGRLRNIYLIISNNSPADVSGVLNYNINSTITLRKIDNHEEFDLVLHEDTCIVKTPNKTVMVKIPQLTFTQEMIIFKKYLEGKEW